MELHRPSQIAALIARVLLGSWFVYSGGLKVFVTGLDRFTNDVGNYGLVAAPWDAAVAYAVPWVEMISGLCLLLGVLRRGALLGLAGLVTVFAVAVGWAWSQGLDISCGCHGNGAALNYGWKAAELTGYLLVFGWLGWMEKRSDDREKIAAI